ncbi:MAG TPA: hypothetical protein EYH40_04765 [Desulfurococcales archaeon]|nr:hypothetical protein [Desulfurococcales archaeon]
MNAHATTIILLVLATSISLLQAYSYTQTLLFNSIELNSEILYDYGLKLVNSVRYSLIHGGCKLTIHRDITLSTYNSIVLFEIVFGETTIAVYEVKYTSLIVAGRYQSVGDVTVDVCVNSDFTVNHGRYYTVISPFIRIDYTYTGTNTILLSIVMPVFKVKGCSWGSTLKLSVRENVLEDSMFVDRDTILKVLVNGALALKLNVSKNTIIHYRIQIPKVIILRI